MVAQQVAPKPARMVLANVVRGKLFQAPRVLVNGVEGIGKSTFAANAPNPIFIGAEDGTHHLDVARAPAPERFEDVLDFLRVLINEPHDFKTVAIDTVDWLEPMIWNFACRRFGEDGKVHEHIEDFGYGKGYLKALDAWRLMLSGLERLNQQKHMNIVLLSHSLVKSWKNPEGEDFDRYTLKIHEKAGGLLKEWCDAVFFANYETFASKDAKTKRVRGVDTGARLLYTSRRAAYDAKNRYGLPESIPLNWDDFMAGVEAGRPASAEVMVAAIERKLEQLGDEVLSAAVRKGVGEAVATKDGARLAQIADRLSAKVSAMEAAADTNDIGAK